MQKNSMCRNPLPFFHPNLVNDNRLSKGFPFFCNRNVSQTIRPSFDIRYTNTSREVRVPVMICEKISKEIDTRKKNCYRN